MARTIFDNYVDLNSFNYLIFRATIGGELKSFLNFHFLNLNIHFHLKKIPLEKYM